MKWIAALAFVCFGAPLAQASVSKSLSPSLSPTSNLSRAFYANKFVAPKVPMWQRTNGTLINPLFGLKKRRVAKANLAARPAKGTQTSKASIRRDGLAVGVLPPTSLHDQIKLPSNHLQMAEKKTKEEIKEERRAKLSTLHQIMGFTTLALLTATVVVGQINAVDFLNDRLSPLPMIWAHRVLSTATGLSYMTGGILSLMFPKLDDGDIEPDEDAGFDSSKWHGALAWVHGMGMLGLFASGILNAHFIPSFTDAKVAFTVGHLALGYITLAALAAAAIIISLF